MRSGQNLLDMASGENRAHIEQTRRWVVAEVEAGHRPDAVEVKERVDALMAQHGGWGQDAAVVRQVLRPLLAAARSPAEARALCRACGLRGPRDPHRTTALSPAPGASSRVRTLAEFAAGWQARAELAVAFLPLLARQPWNNGEATRMLQESSACELGALIGDLAPVHADAARLVGEAPGLCGAVESAVCGRVVDRLRTGGVHVSVVNAFAAMVRGALEAPDGRAAHLQLAVVEPPAADEAAITAAFAEIAAALGATSAAPAERVRATGAGDLNPPGWMDRWAPRRALPTAATLDLRDLPLTTLDDCGDALAISQRRGPTLLFITAEQDLAVGPSAETPLLGVRRGFGQSLRSPELETLLAELAAVPAWRDAQASIDLLVASLQRRRRTAELGRVEMRPSLHGLLLGPAGTGKTTFARLFAKIAAELGLVRRADGFRELSQSDLKGEYLGETDKKTRRVLSEGLGQVLFLDEAYALAADLRYGQEVVDTLLPFLENHKYEFIFLMAGYSDDMQRLFTMNSGLRSRFRLSLDFKPYTDPELFDVLAVTLRRRGLTLSEDEMWSVSRDLGRRRLDPGFGNARDVIKAVESAVAQMALRQRAGLEDDAPAPTLESLTTLRLSDFPAAASAAPPASHVVPSHGVRHGPFLPGRVRGRPLA